MCECGSEVSVKLCGCGSEQGRRRRQELAGEEAVRRCKSPERGIRVWFHRRPPVLGKSIHSPLLSHSRFPPPSDSSPPTATVPPPVTAIVLFEAFLDRVRRIWCLKLIWEWIRDWIQVLVSILCLIVKLPPIAAGRRRRRPPHSGWQWIMLQLIVLAVWTWKEQRFKFTKSNLNLNLKTKH